MVKVKNKGNFDDFKNFLNKAKKIIKYGNIEVVINNCVKRLEDATPKDTGLTSKSWFYEIERNKKNIIVFILSLVCFSKSRLSKLICTIRSSINLLIT